MREADLPLITVAMPAYNHAGYIEASIRGLIEQDYPAIELIVIDDGSSDDTVARAAELAAECRSRFVRFEFRPRENRGLCNTLNEALAWAEGQYFAINDSDDVLLPTALSTLLRTIEADADLNGVFGGAYLIDQSGEKVGTTRLDDRHYDFSDLLDRDKNMISSCGLLRADAMRAAGGYLPDLFIEDWYIMLKLTEGGARLKLIPETLALYRIHPTNISKSIGKMLEARLQILDLFAGHAGHVRRKALVHVAAAIEYWRLSKTTSTGQLATAVRLDPSVVGQSMFWKAAGRILAPAPVIDWLKTRKDRRARQAVDR